MCKFVHFCAKMCTKWSFFWGKVLKKCDFLHFCACFYHQDFACANKLHTLIWNDLCQMLFLYFYSIFLFLTLNARAASTMNQSDIRGLVFRPEPTVIFSVVSFAFYGHEFGSSEINLSYRVVASSFVVPTLLSIIYS